MNDLIAGDIAEILPNDMAPGMAGAIITVFRDGTLGRRAVEIGSPRCWFVENCILPVRRLKSRDQISIED
jgi:hypothetical protein